MQHNTTHASVSASHSEESRPHFYSPDLRGLLPRMRGVEHGDWQLAWGAPCQPAPLDSERSEMKKRAHGTGSSRNVSYVRVSKGCRHWEGSKRSLSQMWTVYVTHTHMCAPPAVSWPPRGPEGRRFSKQLIKVMKVVAIGKHLQLGCQKLPAICLLWHQIDSSLVCNCCRQSPRGEGNGHEGRNRDADGSASGTGTQTGQPLAPLKPWSPLSSNRTHMVHAGLSQLAVCGMPFTVVCSGSWEDGTLLGLEVRKR